MIRTVKGDILLSDAQAIAHGVAPHDHFNQGLALALRERHPAMAKDFRHFCHVENPKPGRAWLWAGPERVVINLMTQEPAPSKNAHPGKATTHNVNHALRELATIVRDQEIRSLALPKLATGVGGLAWDDVEPLIQRQLSELKIPIVIYEAYEPGHKADERIAAS